VKLIRTFTNKELVYRVLNEIMENPIEIDSDLKSAVDRLNELAPGLEIEGKYRNIVIRLGENPDTSVPIRFYAKGISYLEALLILCHRASLDYNIIGSSVYLEPKE